MVEISIPLFVSSTPNLEQKRNFISRTVRPHLDRVSCGSLFALTLGAYTYIERSYEDSSTDTPRSSDERDESVSDDGSPSPPPESALDPPVQALVSLIFDMTIM